MAGTALKKVMNFFIGDGEEEEYEDEAYNSDYVDVEEEEMEGEDGRTGLSSFIHRNNKVVSMPQPQKVQMKIAKPTNFEQSSEIVQTLMERNAIVLNLEYVSKDVARRIIDVTSGAVQALNGSIEKVSNSIFLVTPTNFNIENESVKERVEKNSSNWIK